MSNEFSFTTPQSFDRGGFGIEHEGTYHLIIEAVDARPVKKFGQERGQPISGFMVSVNVLDGTARTPNGKCIEEGKKMDIVFYNPDLSSKDRGEFAGKRQGRFLRVIGLLKDEDAGGQQKKINLDFALNRQFIAKFRKNSKDGKEYIELSFLDMWHVDDPYVAAVPKDARWLKQLPSDQRMASKADFSEPVPAPVANPGKVSVGDL